MRIHCLENVDKALQFLKEQRVHLENMGSHDIVDGNHRLTLGLIWTIILRFQVRDSTWPPGLPAECEHPCKTGLPFQGDQKDQVEMASQSQVCCTSHSAALWACGSYPWKSWVSWQLRGFLGLVSAHHWCLLLSFQEQRCKDVVNPRLLLVDYLNFWQIVECIAEYFRQSCIEPWHLCGLFHLLILLQV